MQGRVFLTSSVPFLAKKLNKLGFKLISYKNGLSDTDGISVRKILYGVAKYTILTASLKK